MQSIRGFSLRYGASGMGLRLKALLHVAVALWLGLTLSPPGWHSLVYALTLHQRL